MADWKSPVILSWYRVGFYVRSLVLRQDVRGDMVLVALMAVGGQCPVDPVGRSRVRP